MLCTDYPTALPLSPCTDEDAKVYVGTSTLPVSYVRLNNLATGRVTVYAADSDSDGWYFIPDGEVFPTHKYLVQLLSDAGPVSFFPYEVSGYSTVPSIVAVMGVYLTFERLVDGDAYFEAGDQFVTV